MFPKDNLKSYVDAMSQAGALITEQKPDFVICPMLGSVPFIDSLAIVSRDFDPSKVLYMPASSRIKDVNDVITRWYSGFLDAQVSSPSFFPKVIALDEVVSGNSVIRCVKNIEKAVDRKRQAIRQSLVSRVHSSQQSIALAALDELDALSDNRYAPDIATLRNRVSEGVYRGHSDLARSDSRIFTDFARQSLAGKLLYRTIGIEDSKAIGKRTPGYEALKEKGLVLPVPVKTILTMDDQRYCPVVLEQIPPCGRGGYIKFSPRVKEFVVSPEYMEFLGTLATYVGRNPQEVAPVNMNAILESSHFLEAA